VAACCGVTVTIIINFIHVLLLEGRLALLQLGEPAVKEWGSP
jgi:ABC-type dipeptide/oligopeptide/nickel transport system permease subunit